jgi:hypothetical protein
MDEPFRAFPSWFLRIECDRCGKVQMVKHAALARPVYVCTTYSRNSNRLALADERASSPHPLPKSNHKNEHQEGGEK